MSQFGDVQRRGGGQFWKADLPGKSITGTYVRGMVGRDYDNTRDVPQMVLETAEGTQVVDGSNAVLNNLILDNEEALVPGAIVTVTYVSQDPRSRAKMYTMEVQGGGAAPVAGIDPGPGIQTHAAPPVASAPPVAPPPVA